MGQVQGRFDEVFKIEMEGWCYGIEHYPGEIFPGLVHMVIQELAPSFSMAFECNYAFDLLELANKFTKAAKYLVHEKEIAFSMLAQFPNPHEMGEDAQFAMAQVVDQIEQAYGGALSRLNTKWEYERQRKAA